MSADKDTLPRVSYPGDAPPFAPVLQITTIPPLLSFNHCFVEYTSHPVILFWGGEKGHVCCLFCGFTLFAGVVQYWLMVRNLLDKKLRDKGVAVRTIHCLG